MAWLVIRPDTSHPAPGGFDDAPSSFSGTRIRTRDDVLDLVAEQFSKLGDEGSPGFWLAGQLQKELNGEVTNPDPDAGHQRMWIPIGTVVHLIYDRSLSANPDRLEDRSDTVYL